LTKEDHKIAKVRWNEFRILPRRFKIYGIVLFAFVFLNKKSRFLSVNDMTTLLNHERIHVRQQLELLILPFFIIYIAEWLVLLLKYRNKNLAYRNISFEKEAYDNADELGYLKNRRPYAWLNYWKRG
jgi:hypothetical protein